VGRVPHRALKLYCSSSLTYSLGQITAFASLYWWDRPPCRSFAGPAGTPAPTDESAFGAPGTAPNL
jgi:hypothetical protein